METATYVALSRQSVLGRTLDVLANNLANLSTTGFKGEESVFQQFLEPGPDGQTIAYVRDVGTVRDTRQGDLTPTGNPLDTAIDGNGYFTVNSPQGPAYTRDGRFRLNPQGQLVTNDGDPVLDDTGQPITVPTGSGKILIAHDGSISTATGGQVAKLGVVSFTAPQRMTSVASGLYTSSEAPTPDTTSNVQQGMLEASNIRPIVEMTRLLDVQRAYTSAQDVLDGENSRLTSAIDKLSRVA